MLLLIYMLVISFWLLKLTICLANHLSLRFNLWKIVYNKKKKVVKKAQSGHRCNLIFYTINAVDSLFACLLAGV